MFLRLARVILLFTVIGLLPGETVRAEEEVSPIQKKEVPKAWEWEKVEGCKPSIKDSGGLFLYQFYRPPQGQESFGPLAFAVFLRDIPELGALYEAWGITRGTDGGCDFTAATFAYQKSYGWWLVAPPHFMVSVGFGEAGEEEIDGVEAIVYRRVFTKDPKFRGRMKILREYRVCYSSFTLKKIILVVEDLEKKTLHDIGKLELSTTPVGEREIKRKRVLTKKEERC